MTNLGGGGSLTPPPVNPLEDAFKFAQALADREIAAIDRLHQRSLKYIGYGAGAFGLLLSFFAWVGYQNLKETAINVATKEVQDEVVRQVQTQLTTKGVADVVHGETDGFVKGELRNQLHAEITKGPLHQEILSTASAQSRDLINAQFAPRHFTDAQAVKLENAIAQSSDLTDHPVIALPQIYDLEAQQYGREIERALQASKVKYLQGSISSPAADAMEGMRGLVIYFEETTDRKYADSLARAFRSAGLDVAVKGSKYYSAMPIKGSTTVCVFVGAKPRFNNASK
jgi:hypothetical protein